MFDPICCEAEGRKRSSDQKNKTKQNWKNFVTSLGQKSPADMLENMISSMAKGSHAFKRG